MRWNEIVGFNFTYALQGGAWVKDSMGYVSWESNETIIKHKGEEWLRKQRERQGMFTGCWIKCV